MTFHDDDDDEFGVRVSEWETRGQEGPKRVGDAATRLDLLRRIERQGGEAESPGGTVRVSVDARGRVATMWLDPRLSSVPLDELAGHIVNTCAAAFNQRLAEIARTARENADLLEADLVTHIEVMTGYLARTAK